MRMRRILFAAVIALAGCNTDESSEAELQPTHAPGYTSSDSYDDLSAHDPDDIVVDFRDGLSKEQIDAYEQAWGIDLEYADAEEGPQSGITVAHVDPERAATLLEEIRNNPDVEVAEAEMMF